MLSYLIIWPDAVWEVVQLNFGAEKKYANNLDHIILISMKNLGGVSNTVKIR